MKKTLPIVASILATLIVIIGGYIIYGYTTYYRLPDIVTLETTQQQDQMLEAQSPYTISTFNIGYAAYPQDYSFFMDGGRYSRAYDKETVQTNLSGIAQAISDIHPTIALFQEVDVDGDRSQHVNEVDALQQAFSNYASVFTQNYDSPYLFYPLLDPIGKAKSGLLTLANRTITSSTRYSLPIETNFNKFFDLDRAFVVSYIPVANGKQLAVINLHLSAYTKDPSIGAAQLEKLFTQMEKEYEAGHYVIVGGDFNHDILQGDSPKVFHTTDEPQTWTHPFPTDQLSSHFHLVTDGLREATIPSARALNEGYVAGQTFTTLVDGFIVSDNITPSSVQVHQHDFMNSDHNPVSLSFILN